MNTDNLKNLTSSVSTETDRIDKLISVYRTAEIAYRTALRVAIKRQEAIASYDQNKCNGEGIDF